ncbi:MAG: hypothetical protein R3C30_09145 [Hyphomonadaceae bacterium]
MRERAALQRNEVTFDHRLEPFVRVHHTMRGRTRLRLDPLRGRPDLLGALARRIAAREGVTDVRESPWSGALLIEHDAALSAETIAQIARDIWRDGLAAPAQEASEELAGKPGTP